MNRSILFFIGLLIGILICALIYYFNIKIPKIPLIIEKKEVITRIDTVYLETPQKHRNTNIETILDDTVENDNINEILPEDEVSMYETEFFFDEEDQDDVFSDRLINTRTVRVKILFQDKQEVKLPENLFQSFEIQQWSTPIKNKISYCRNQNLLKIKGLDIDKINLVFWNETYFLEIGNLYYAIPESNNFEKLNLIQIPQ